MTDIERALADLDTTRQLLTRRTIERDNVHRLLQQRTADHDAVVAERNELAERVVELESTTRDLLLALADEQERKALRVSTWSLATRVQGLLGPSR